MAYNFLAELPPQPNWRALADLISRSPGVEAFPITPSRKDEPPAIGVSVPGKHADEETWSSLEQLLAELAQRFHATVYELYTGEAVSPDNLPAVRSRLLGLELQPNQPLNRTR